MTLAPQRGLDRLKLFLITGFGSGFSPIAPGTVGSAVACLIVACLPSGGWFLPLVVTLVVASTLISGALGPFAERTFGRKDPGAFVLDEFAGVFVTVLHPDKPGLVGLVLAFAVFRVFDIVKPFPVRQAETLPGGWGIVADDLVAGVFANLVLLFLGLLQLT